jgi:hypothetical protein
MSNSNSDKSVHCSLDRRHRFQLSEHHNQWGLGKALTKGPPTQPIRVRKVGPKHVDESTRRSDKTYQRIVHVAIGVEGRQAVIKVVVHIYWTVAIRLVDDLRAETASGVSGGLFVERVHEM